MQVSKQDPGGGEGELGGEGGVGGVGGGGGGEGGEGATGKEQREFASVVPPVVIATDAFVFVRLQTWMVKPAEETVCV